MSETQSYFLSDEATPYVIAHGMELLATVEQADEALLPDELVEQARAFRAFLGEHLEAV